MYYGDISPRTAAYADRKLLKRAQPNNILGQFGQNRPLPTKNGKTIIFRRYNSLAAATVPLQEGVTPTGKSLTKTDVQVSVDQYGDFVTITDIILDHHEDPVLNESIEILGEQAAKTWDLLRAGVLTAGTNLYYSNGLLRTAVNKTITRDILRRVDRILGRAEAEKITSIVQAGPKVSTEPIPPAYVVVHHVDLKMDVEACEGFVPVHKYASTQGLINGEYGSVGEFRFVIDNNLTPWADAGGVFDGSGTSMLSTTGAKADVYPMLVFAKNAYGVVPLAGKESVSTYVNNPKSSISDPLAQRGTVGWKGSTATVILYDNYMLRIEVAARA